MDRTDEQWAVVEPLLPEEERTPPRKAASLIVSCLRLIARFAKTAQNRNKLRKTLRSLCSQRFESAVCAQQGD